MLLAEDKSGVSQKKLGEEELRAIDAEGKENERLATALQALLTDLQDRTDRLIQDHCARIVETLRDVVHAYSDMECANLRQAIAEGHSGRAWRCDATPLRQRLEECFVGAYREAEQEIGKLESLIFPQLKQLLHRYQPQWRQRGGDNGELAGAALPLLSALSEVVALDLDEPWWKQWWTRRSGEDQVAELDRLIRTEFYRITDALAQAARAHLEARQASTLQEANMVYVGLVGLLKEQNNARMDRTRALMSGADPARVSGLQRTKDARVAELKAQNLQHGASGRPARNHRAGMDREGRLSRRPAADRARGRRYPSADRQCGAPAQHTDSIPVLTRARRVAAGFAAPRATGM